MLRCAECGFTDPDVTFFYLGGEGDLVAKYGYADSYRGAMDSIAHAVLCKLEGASL